MELDTFDLSLYKPSACSVRARVNYYNQQDYSKLKNKTSLQSQNVRTKLFNSCNSADPVCAR